MKRSLVLSLLAILAVCGCQVKEEGEFAPEGKSFTATMEATVGDATDIGTKTSLDNLNVLWTLGDQVSIFVGSTVNEHYQVTDASDGKTAAALFRVENPESVPSEAISNNVAFYPYEATAGIVQNGSSYVISDIVFPYTQYFAQASFGNGAFPMVAVTSSTGDYSLKFKNVLGGLKLRLKGTAEITSVSITGNNGEILCGSAEVTASADNAPSVEMTDADGTRATLICQEYVQLSETEATAFIIALPPMTMTGGFTVVVCDSQGASMEIQTTRSQTITRSNILSMPEVTYVGTAPYVPPVPEAVDLGLPSGIKWASFNLGAAAPEEYGDYYAWGETEPYYESQDPLVWKSGKAAGYNWQSYRFGTSTNLTKYNIDSNHGSVIDNKTRLELSDDAANASWGGAWRMPTYDEWLELIATKENTSSYQWELKTINGHDGWEVKCLANGNSIFLPVTGIRSDDRLGNGCDYWSSSLVTGGFDGLLAADPSSAWTAWIDQDMCGYWPMYRMFGCPVRPVTDEDVLVSVTGISLDKSSMALDVEEESTVTATVSPSNATKKDVIWSSSDRSVATVSWEGVVTAVTAGHATITATTYDGGFTATCAVTVQAIPEAVDLGLPSGIKWASYNLGANAPEDFGDFFAWGEEEPYYSSKDLSAWKDGKTQGYKWTSYTWCNGSSSTLTRYNTDSAKGTVDNKTVLAPDDDAAYAELGGNWRMPTEAEWSELMANCTWTWTEQGGVSGRLVTSNTNGNSIFLPAAGYLENKLQYFAGSSAGYWSSSLNSASPDRARYMDFASNSRSITNANRYWGLSIRPVSDEGVRVSVTRVSLNRSSLSLLAGNTASLTATVAPANATQPAVIWSSSNTAVATVNYNGVVTAVSVGTAIITATTYDGGRSETCGVCVSAPEAVDLGLTSGLKWSSCNIDASAPEDYGNYFGWGEVEPAYNSKLDMLNHVGGFGWNEYQWCDGSNRELTKYCTNKSYGTVDNKTVLDPEDDAARVNWGGAWRMPTWSDWYELLAQCEWTRTTQNGIDGFLVTGSNNNSIFLPSAGVIASYYLDYAGTCGYYWTTALSSETPTSASIFFFNTQDYFRNDIPRAYGGSIRPVTE